MKKAILITLLFVGVLVLGTSAVKADEARDYPPIIQKLVEKFGLNEDEVKSVFDENRAEKQAEKQAEREEKLSQAVSDGVITEDQKQALIAKHEEMRANKSDHKEEMRAWFESQGIDHETLREYVGGPKGPGRRGRSGRS